MNKENPYWYKEAIFYEVYIRAFCDSNGDGHGDINGLIQKLDYIKELGVDCIWILPHYPSPLKDDGYDIADYYDVHPDYGTLADFKRLVIEVHRRGLKIITDLVLNHTSDQHAWFQSAQADRQSPYRDYYVWSDTDSKYQKARIIFLDHETSNWAWHEETQQYYWHRFYSSQPDLNYDNPKVQQEMLDVAKFWLDIGADGFRADAVPYLFEREGTNCENLPETHAYLKRLRRFVDENYPSAIILCEANQWPEDVRPYFGEGDEVHMNFHFPLMPRIFMALRRHSVAPIKQILAQTPPIPETCQWCTFLRNHDELTLEMVTEEERQWMWQEYAPEARMRLNLGIRRRLAPLLENDRGRILLAHSLLLTLPGSPIIYYGDELGMGDNIWLKDRDGVRTPMQWEDSNSAGFSPAIPNKLYAPVIDEPPFGFQEVNAASQINDHDSLFCRIKHMIAARKAHRAFGYGELQWVETPDEIAAYWRIYQEEKILVLHNLSNRDQTVSLPEIDHDHATLFNILEQKSLRTIEKDFNLQLAPYGFVWLAVK